MIQQSKSQDLQIKYQRTVTLIVPITPIKRNPRKESEKDSLFSDEKLNTKTIPSIRNPWKRQQSLDRPSLNHNRFLPIIYIFHTKLKMVFCFADSKQKIQKILDENGGVAVLDICTKTCVDCDKLDPFVEQMNYEKKIPVIKIDADQYKDLCSCCKVKGIPCFAVIKEKWENCIECKQCHQNKEVLEIFNTAVQCRNNLHKLK